jgi:acyl-CoA thioester hydrolase
MENNSAFHHSTPIEIRFNDMDAFGHVNNALYLTYLEEARINYLDSIIDWEYKPSNYAIIMAQAEINFLFPLHYKSKISILTRCSHVGNKSFTLEYNVMWKTPGLEEKLVATAKTVVVMYDYDSGQSIPVPDRWKEILQWRFNSYN